MDEHKNSGPQLEDGFLRIANELFDAILRFRFTLKQQSVVLSIARKTYGYGKKTDDVSASQIGELCGIARNHVTETLRQLASMNVITLERGEYGMIVGINKHHRQWKELAKAASSPESGLVPNQDASSPESGLQLVPNQDGSIVPNQDTQKTTFQKTTSKDNPKRQTPRADAQSVPEEFAEFWAAYPKREGGNSKAAAMKAWNARTRAGVSAADMLAGVQRYAAYCAAKGMTGTQYVKQASTFLGPDEHWAAEWAVQAKPVGETNSKGARKLGGLWVI